LGSLHRGSLGGRGPGRRADLDFETRKRWQRCTDVFAEVDPPNRKKSELEGNNWKLGFKGIRSTFRPNNTKKKKKRRSKGGFSETASLEPNSLGRVKNIRTALKGKTEKEDLGPFLKRGNVRHRRRCTGENRLAKKRKVAWKKFI